MQNTVFFSFEILLFVKVGGKKATDFIKLNNFGPMGLFIKGIWLMTWLIFMEGILVQKAISMKENGWIIRHMGLENVFIKMELNI